MKKYKRFKITTLLFSLFFSLCSCSCSKTPVNPNDRFINFYYINDTHGAFIRQNTDSNYNEAGMAYISSYLKEKYNSDPNNTIILSGGDMFQGGFESNTTYGEIMVDAMNEIGFDAMVLGNHELDWGEEKLMNIAEKLNCPILSCNTFYRDTEDIPEYISPTTLVEKDGLKIGIIGAASENMNTSISGSISQNFSFPNPISYIKTYSRSLRTEEKCDLVILATHDGGFDGNNFKYKSLCEIDSTTHKEYVDGIFLAHDHRYKDGDYLGVPYLESGCNGRYVGNMKFELAKDGADYSILQSWTENVSAYRNCLVEDSSISSLLTKYEDVIKEGDEVVYTFKKNYTREEFAKVICEAMFWYINENKEQFGGYQIYFTSHNPGGVRTEVSKGPMKMSQLVSTCPFDNNIYIQKCTANNINYMKDKPSSYIYYEADEIIYDNGYTYAATISYLAENENYSRYIHVEATEYQITAKSILIEYLKNNINTNL